MKGFGGDGPPVSPPCVMGRRRRTKTVMVTVMMVNDIMQAAMVCKTV